MLFLSKVLAWFRRGPTCGHPQGDHHPDSDGLPLALSFVGGHWHCTRGPWPWSQTTCTYHEHGGGGGSW